MILLDAAADGLELALGDVVLFLSFLGRNGDIGARAVEFSLLARTGRTGTGGEAFEEGAPYHERERGEFLEQSLSLAAQRFGSARGCFAHALARIIAYIAYAIQAKRQLLENQDVEREKRV
jgi:hypothetical protein